MGTSCYGENQQKERINIVGENEFRFSVLKKKNRRSFTRSLARSQCIPVPQTSEGRLVEGVLGLVVLHRAAQQRERRRGPGDPAQAFPQRWGSSLAPPWTKKRVKAK